MAKYQEFDSVLLKDGRIASIVEVYELGTYDADVGHSPKDWKTLWGLTDDDIERKATPEEIAREAAESKRQLEEQGLWQ
jgi:hypothetical protein